MPRRTAGASRTSATSPSITGRLSFHRHDRIAQVLDVFGAPDGSYRPLHRAFSDEAARGVDVAPWTACSISIEGDAAGRHALGIELHLELPQITAKPFDGGNARNRQEPVAHFKFSQVSQGHQIGCAGVGF